MCILNTSSHLLWASVDLYPPPLDGDYNGVPNIKALKGTGFINHTPKTLNPRESFLISFLLSLYNPNFTTLPL